MLKRILMISSMILMSSNSFADDNDNFSVGIGLGVPYGLIGANITYQFNDTIDAMIGAGLGFGAGVRYHPFESARKFRVLAYYGTNAAYTLTTTVGAASATETKTFTGMNFGFGYGNISDGWDIDLIYIIKSQQYKDDVAAIKARGAVVSGDTEERELGISFGYHW